MLGSPCSARLRSAMRRVIELQPSMARLYKKAERPMSLAEFALIDRIRARTLERDDILLGIGDGYQLQRLAAPAGQHHRKPARQQCAGGSPADAAAGSGDDGDA